MAVVIFVLVCQQNFSRTYGQNEVLGKVDSAMR